MSSAQTNRPLNECPTNVKEALEWLAALESGASACEGIINQKILGSTNGYTSGNLNGVCQTLCTAAAAFMTTIKNGSGGASYTSTSTYQGAQWNYLCQNTGGSTKCCASTTGRGCHSCNASGAHCDGCCKNCPQQICARIFCLIVPVVYSALHYLQYVLLQNGGHGHGNNEQYLQALGFNNGAGLSLTVQHVQQALRQQQPPPSGTLVGLLHALHSATVQINTALQNNTTIFVDGQSTGTRSRYYSSTTPQLTTPTSAKDLMLWTIFLPYCCNYQEVYQRLQGSLLSTNGGTNSGAPGGGSSPLSPLEGLISGLHVLFIGMEAGGQGLSSSSSSYSQTLTQPPRTLFQGIYYISHGWAPYEYYTSGSSGGGSYGDAGTEQCCKLLVAGIPIISSAVEMLLQQNGGAAHGYGSGYGIGIEQHLGFSGNSGMQQLSPPLGAHFFDYVSLALEQVKTAYGSDQFQGLISYGTTTYTGHSQGTPRTFREMLLWLQGLPCSQAYSAVRGLLSANSGSSSSSTTLSNGQSVDPLVNIIFKLPYLFYHLEGMTTAGGGSRVSHSNGTMTGYITELFERQGIKVNGSNSATGSKGPAGTMTPFSYDQGTIQQHFCAIVTVVYYVVDHLGRKYKGERNLHGITDGSLGAFLEFLGWPGSGASVFSVGTHLTSVLQYCFGNTSVVAHSSGTNGDNLSQLFQQLRGKLSNGSTTSTHSAPTTFRDTLLWLVGAPLTQEYESKKTEWNNKLPSRTSSHSSTDTLANHITDTIVGVLQLFNKLEGNMIQTVMTLFGNGNGTSVSLRYNYSATGSTSGASTNNNLGHSIFGTTVVMRSVFGFLQQRCNGMVASGAVSSSSESSPNYSWHSCSVTCGNGGKPASTTTECQADNNLCKFLCLLGWDHKTRSGAQSTTTKDSASFTGTTFHADLVSWFGTVSATDQGALSSSYPVTYNSNEQVLKNLYQYAVQWFQEKTGGATTTTPSSTTTTPTIKEMMLWLIGLPLHSVYTELTGSNASPGASGVIKTKFDSLKSRTNKANHTYGYGSQLSDASDVTNAIVSSSQGMIITMLAIEGNVTSILEYLKGNFLSKDSKGSVPSHGSSAEACLELLVDYTYKVHFQLRFLLVMCNTDRSNGGWKDCEYRGSGTGQCNCSDKVKTSCLKKFLEDGSTGIKSTTANKFVGPEKEGNVGMGFLNGTLTTTPSTTTNSKLKGSDIYALLKYFVDTATENNRNTLSASTPPLSLLAQCIVAIGQRGPQSLGDCFELLWQLGNGTLYSYVDRELKEELKGIMLEMTGGQNNGQNGAESKLITAIQDIIPGSAKHTDHKDKRDLSSLMCSNAGGSSNSCAPYMKSLSSGLYSFYAPQITDSSVNFPFLQYLYDMLKKLLDKMKELQKAFDKCPCCKQSGSSSSTCDGLISCPNAHPILYKFGFVFGDAEKLKTGTSKKCENLKAQLKVVLSCEHNKESALFSAFECVIQVTYSILLEKAKGKVSEKYNTNNGNGKTTTGGLKSTNQEMNTAFTLYVENAMYLSYPKLICTFACKVFDGNHKCQGDTCKERFKDAIQKPTNIIPASPSSSTPVSSSAVTTITAVIPKYSQPVIDPYHYKTFEKKDSVTASGASASDTSSSSNYSFKDAIDFHVSGANCIRPAPVALRSVIDWILRVTTGAIATQGDKEQNNKMIQQLSEAVKSVFNTAGVGVDDVQQNVIDLVQGLRKFVGYQERSGDVIKGVKNVLENGTNGNGVKGALQTMITAIEKFIGQDGKDKFALELGKALLKGRYEGTFKQKRGTLADTIISTIAALTELTTGIQEPLEQKAFAEVVKTFSDILTSKHKNCNSQLNCTGFTATNSADSSSGSGTVTAQGLKDLYTFFEQLNTFAALWDSIGKTNGGGILQQQKATAMNVQWTFNGSNGSSPSNGDYFTKLYEALKALGACAQKVQALENKNGNPSSDSTKYRQKISELIKYLKDEVLSKLKDSTDSQSNGKADPQYAVKGAEELIKKTISNVEAEITKKLKETAELSYTLYVTDEHILKIGALIFSMKTNITQKLDRYKSHLDDLKQLCQWLYRMGQLYAHGLKGFVESLISHLGHIIQTIKWIEGIEKMMTKLKDIDGKDKLCETISGFDDIKDCCQNSGHQSLCNGSNKFTSRDGFFTALNCRIDNLLTSYVLGPLPEGNSDKTNDTQKVQERRQLLSEIRLLALDRYTLQVWQDECNDNGNCKIKNWITFEDGIIRHSDLDAIKEALKSLTTITPVASHPAPPSASHRIHDFHAICVIQKFSYEAPIAELEESLKELKGIQGQLSAVKGRCNGSTTDVSNDTEITSFCTAVSQFLQEPYGIYNFAKFVHTIMGPNIFSAVIGALEELKDPKQYNKNNGNGNLDKIKGILGVLTAGLEGENNKEHYKLDEIIKKLESFISALNKEYIFCYPVVTCKAQTKAVAAQSQPLVSAAEPNAQSIIDRLKSVTPPCPSDFHNDASVCNSCYNIFAYILLGQVPKLYHSFRFMSWMLNNGWKVNSQVQNGAQPQGSNAQHPVNGKISSYLVSMGFAEGNIQNVQSGQGTTGVNTQLHTTFNTAVDGFKQNASTPPTATTYEPNGLKEIHDMLESLLKRLIEKEHTNALHSIANGGNDTRRRPRTIRDMLHWLSGVPFSVGYSEMQQVSNSLCDLTLAMTTVGDKQELKHNIKPEPIEYRLGVSCAECLDVLQAVEDPLGKEPTRRYREYIATHDFYYPANASELFYMFVDVIYNVYVQMKFVCNMTGRDKTEGGWERCNFWAGKPLRGLGDNMVKEADIVCKCMLSGRHFTCQLACRRFLDGSNDSFFRPKYPLGFTINKIPNTSIKGAVIHNVIKHIFGSGNNYSVLCRLLLAVSSCPPTSIGDMISFLYWYRQKMFPGDGKPGATTQADAEKYRNALHQEIELFPGTFDASKLTGALGALMSEHGAGGRTTSGATHTHNLSSVMYCEDAMVVKPQPQPPAPAPQTQQPSDPSASCAPYLRPLAQEIYNVYVPQFSRAYLSWILHFGPRVYTALEELKGKLNGNCEHCKKSDSSIVTCNSVLPELYSKGLDFYDPKVLNGQKKNQQNGSYQQNGGTKRTCVFFATQLGAVLRTCSPGNPSSPGAPLHRLIEAIEQFLWSIRLPFSLVQLSLWSFAVFFISYVFVVPLDHFKIKSHLFNRLKYTMHPSLLIADGQRRVSEVAYFSL